MNRGLDKDTMIFFITLMVIMAAVYFRVDAGYDKVLKDTKLQRQRTYYPNQN